MSFLILLAGLALAETPAPTAEVINIDAGCGTGITTPAVRPGSLFPGETEKKLAEARAIELRAKAECVTAQAKASATVQLARASDAVARKGGVVEANVVGGGSFGTNLEKMPHHFAYDGGYGYVGYMSSSVSEAFLRDSGIAATSHDAPPPASTTPAPTAPAPNANAADAVWALGG